MGVFLRRRTLTCAWCACVCCPMQEREAAIKQAKLDKIREDIVKECVGGW